MSAAEREKASVVGPAGEFARPLFEGLAKALKAARVTADGSRVVVSADLNVGDVDGLPGALHADLGLPPVEDARARAAPTGATDSPSTSARPSSVAMFTLSPIVTPVSLPASITKSFTTLPPLSPSRCGKSSKRCSKPWFS